MLVSRNLYPAPFNDIYFRKAVVCNVFERALRPVKPFVQISNKEHDKAMRPNLPRYDVATA
jgi:hypothetical protein